MAPDWLVTFALLVVVVGVGAITLAVFFERRRNGPARCGNCGARIRLGDSGNWGTRAERLRDHQKECI
jgi:hypothetical protein